MIKILKINVPKTNHSTNLQDKINVTPEIDISEVLKKDFTYDI